MWIENSVLASRASRMSAAHARLCRLRRMRGMLAVLVRRRRGSAKGCGGSLRSLAGWPGGAVGVGRVSARGLGGLAGTAPGLGWLVGLGTAALISGGMGESGTVTSSHRLGIRLM